MVEREGMCMIVRNVLTGETFEVRETTEHPASSYGKPVLVRTDTGEALDRWYLEEVRGNRDIAFGQDMN
jgi:hypothetical protein